jgi:prepilin-type N-terminal cleavage/methylation domain-containing protein
MTCGRPIGFVVGRPASRWRQGFTLIEMVMTVAVVLITAVIAVPLVQNVTAYFKLRGAVSSVTGAIQSTRYQAIYQGCQYQIVFTAAPGAGQPANYQVQGEPYSAASQTCGAAFVNICPAGFVSCPVPLSGSGNAVTLNADITLTFKPSGSVFSPQFPGGGMNMTLTYMGKPPELITISNYGSINVTP